LTTKNHILLGKEAERRTADAISDDETGLRSG